jgi:hypothetical protein
MTEIKARHDVAGTAARHRWTVTESAPRGQSGSSRPRGSPTCGFGSAFRRGCSGFQYGFALDRNSEPDDVAIEKDGITVVVDACPLMYVLGSQLDFVET